MDLGRRAIALLLIVAAGCGGEGASALGPGDYVTQLARISENAHIQQRGLARDLRVRLERATPGQEKLNVVVVYVGQSARLYQDVVDALTDLEPTEGFEGVHEAYLSTWQGQLELTLKVRDAGFHTATGYLEALETAAFKDASEETRSRCEDLQAALVALGREVDLGCGGRPS